MTPPTSSDGGRRILRRGRDVMAQTATNQEWLDQIVRVIGADMVAEVCSIYVRRADNVLELCATQGLNPEAVHRTTLRGVILEEGSATAHVAIVARAQGGIGRVEDILNEVEPGDRIIVDGNNGQVFLRPADEVYEQFQHNLQLRVEQHARFVTSRDLPCAATDGTGVSLLLNAGL